MKAPRLLQSPLAQTWNREIFTEPMALHYCKNNALYVVHDRREEFGKFATYKGYSFILVNPELDTPMRLWVLWHEIGHYLLHWPDTAHFSKAMHRKNDAEANRFASIAIMPQPILVGRTIDEVIYRFGYPREIVQIRYDIHEREGI